MDSHRDDYWDRQDEYKNSQDRDLARIGRCSLCIRMYGPELSSCSCGKKLIATEVQNNESI